MTVEKAILWHVDDPLPAEPVRWWSSGPSGVLDRLIEAQSDDSVPSAGVSGRAASADDLQPSRSIVVAYLTMAEGLKLAAQTFTRDVTKLSYCAA